MRQWLKDWRKEHGDKTQEDMSELLGIPATTYAGYEQGARSPRPEQAKQIAKQLNVDWTIFFENQLVKTRK